MYWLSPPVSVIDHSYVFCVDGEKRSNEHSLSLTVSEKLSYCWDGRASGLEEHVSYRFVE